MIHILNRLVELRILLRWKGSLSRGILQDKEYGRGYPLPFLFSIKHLYKYYTMKGVKYGCSKTY